MPLEVKGHNQLGPSGTGVQVQAQRVLGKSVEVLHLKRGPDTASNGASALLHPASQPAPSPVLLCAPHLRHPHLSSLPHQATCRQAGRGASEKPQ